MHPITIPNSLPPTLVAVSAETLDQVQALATRAQLAQVVDVSSFEHADALMAEINRTIKAIESGRMELKRPVIDLGRQLDNAAGEALAPLLGVTADLRKRINDFTVAENQRRQEEDRRRRAAAEEARRQAQAEADAKRQAEEAAAASIPPEDLPPPDLTPVIIPEVMVAPVRELRSTSVVSKRVKRVVIKDPNLVPYELVMNGQPTRLWLLDEAKVRKLALAGVTIPGVEVIDDTALAAKG